MTEAQIQEGRRSREHTLNLKGNEALRPFTGRKPLAPGRKRPRHKAR